MPPPSRTPEQIRASIEANRAELAHSLVRLRGEVAEITDWRGQIVKHQKQVLIGAAAAGFVLGGLAGFLAYRAFKSGAPPTPDMAIEEAKRIRETVSS